MPALEFVQARLYLVCGGPGTQAKEGLVERKVIRVSDVSGAEIPEGKGAVAASRSPTRAGARASSMTDEEAEKLGGRAVARRGRRPRTTS